MSYIGKKTGILFLLAVLRLCPRADAQTDQWLQLRGDRHMSGRSAGIGYMRDGPPQEGWRYDIAAWETYLSVHQQGGNPSVSLPFPTPIGTDYIAKEQLAWGIGPQVFDLAGDGNLHPMAVDNSFKVAAILRDVDGLQRFEMGDSFSDGGAAPKRGRLLAYDRGEPRIVWETESFEDTWDPNVLVVDADNDGQLDIAVATHYRILVFDGATGATKMQLRYHDYRNYGWFGAANIDADPYPEFALIADFSMHAEVIDNDGEVLSLRWLHRIQPDPAQSTKVVRPKANALLDVDDDGTLELVYSIYNDSGDNQWHILVLDALSGETRWDMAQRFLHGSADLDGDGRLEFFVSATPGEALPTYAPLEVWTLSEPTPTRRWHHPKARFSSRALERLPLSSSTGAADGLRTTSSGDTDGDGRPEFFAVEPDGQAEVLHAYGADPKGQIRSLWSVRGPPGATLTLAAVGDPDSNGVKEALLYLKGRGSPDQQLVFAGVGGILHQSNRQAFTPAGTPVVADLDQDGAVEVVVQTATEEVLCLQAPQGHGNTPRPRWQIPGHGQTNNAPFHWGVVAADLDQDGQLEVLFAREAASGNASLLAVNASGQTKWQTPFLGFDGSMPIWNFSGLSYWNPGHFRTAEYQDVFVSLRRGKLGSEVGFLVDGRSGVILWQSNGYTLPQDGSARSLGGHPSAAGDIDGDGLEEIVLMWPDRLHIVDGLTGQARLVRQTYSYTNGLEPMFVADGFVGYAFPAVLDLFGDSRPELLWGHNGYLNAVLDGDGNPFWQTPYRNNTQVQSLMGIGDSNGNGALELLASTADGIRLFSPTDGTVLHSLQNIAPAHTDIVSGDIDGDGRDEFLFASGAQVFCIEAERDQLRLAWTINTEGRSSDIALADVNGDKYLDLVVTTTDGYVKAYIGATPPTAVPASGMATPPETKLNTLYPNPFNSAVNISFNLDQATMVHLDIFSLSGQHLKSLIHRPLAPGDHQARWHSKETASGVYLVRLQAGNDLKLRKALLIK